MLTRVKFPNNLANKDYLLEYLYYAQMNQQCTMKMLILKCGNAMTFVPKIFHQ